MSLVQSKRVKLTATYLNAGAGGMFTAGVVAPIAAAVFGVTGGSGQLPTLTLGLGALTFLIGSITMHAAARFVLEGLGQ